MMQEGRWRFLWAGLLGGESQAAVVRCALSVPEERDAD
jgi:hypothetical protein